MSNYYEACHYCREWARGDDLVLDSQGYYRCMACASGRCINCRRRAPEDRSNLCLGCAGALGVAPLLDTLGHGIRLEEECLEHPVIGLAEALYVQHGEPALFFSIPWAFDDDEEVHVVVISVDLIHRVEVCVRLERDEEEEITEESYERLDAWMQLEYRLDEIREWEESGQWELVTAEEENARPASPVGMHPDTKALLDVLGAVEEDELD
jgi:hypothetical protein